MICWRNLRFSFVQRWRIESCSACILTNTIAQNAASFTIAATVVVMSVAVVIASHAMLAKSATQTKNQIDRKTILLYNSPTVKQGDTMCKATINITNSKADRYGNRYGFVEYICNETGRTVTFNATNAWQNARLLYRAMGFDSREVDTNEREIGIREFDRTVKGMRYGGCSHHDMAEFVRNALAS